MIADYGDSEKADSRLGDKSRGENDGTLTSHIPAFEISQDDAGLLFSAVRADELVHLKANIDISTK